MKGSVDNMDMFVETRSTVLYDDNGEPASPFHMYYMMNDFTQILDRILDGTIPTATGQPFSVKKNPKFESDASPMLGGDSNIFVRH